jgi:hypothetical protein
VNVLHLTKGILDMVLAPVGGHDLLVAPVGVVGEEDRFAEQRALESLVGGPIEAVA